MADPPQAWQRLGFTVQGSRAVIGGVEIELGAPGRGIVSWSFAGLGSPLAIPGVQSDVPAAPALADDPSEHPNGALAVDHVVLLAPDFEATAGALARAGLGLRRVTRGRHGARLGFRRAGATILELVEVPSSPHPSLWGLTVTVADIDRLAERLGHRLGPVRDAVQPGRRIAPLRASGALSTALAFMDPGVPTGQSSPLRSRRASPSGA